VGFKIISSAFKDTDYIPRWYSRSHGDSSPPIGWTKPPRRTASLVLIVTCKDQSSDNVYCHWVIYNIPPKADTIFGNQPHRNVSHDGTLQGVNSFGGVGWDGPDEDVPDQTLVFSLYALDTKLDLPGGVSHLDIEDAIEGHILEIAKLTGRYSPH